MYLQLLRNVYNRIINNDDDDHYGVSHMNKLHNELTNVLSFDGLLSIDADEMEKNIGKEIRLKPELWDPSYGTLKRDCTYIITLVQKNYCGEKVYCALRKDSDDNFGTLFQPNEIDFL